MSMLSNLELIRRVPLFALLTAHQAEAVADAENDAEADAPQGKRCERVASEKKNSPSPAGSSTGVTTINVVGSSRPTRGLPSAPAPPAPALAFIQRLPLHWPRMAAL